jgi:predicted DNA-binding mobile mystery protein A
MFGNKILVMMMRIDYIYLVMRSEFKSLRLQQLDRALEPYRAARPVPRPSRGWIRTIRQALGLSSAELARRLGTSRQLPLQLEKGEAEDRITLKSLRTAANALDCDLVYAFVPRAGSMQELIENRARAEAKNRVLSVEHSMALENQAVGRIDEAVEAETRRLVRRRRSR